MIKLAVTGCQGRMGKSITRLAFEDSDFAITTLLEAENHPKAGEKENHITINVDPDLIKGCDVMIDFTSPEATLENIEYCLDHHVKMVIGTTGLTQEQRYHIIEASEKIPIVYSSNMSVGVNILFKLSEIVAKQTKDKYKINITEVHHVHKKDAPSGTAKTLAEIIKEASMSAVENIESIREGEIIGDHTVIFDSTDDAITISHHAKNRDIFAKGALIAAKFLKDKAKGLYTMQDVLDLK